MTTFTETVDVHVDLRTAYNQWTQFEDFPHFMEGVERVDQVTDTELHWVTKVGPVTREYDAVITEQRPDEVIAWRSTSGTTNEGRVTFDEIDAQTTQVTAMLVFEPEDLLERIGAASGAIENRLASDMRRFKDFIESRGVESGGWRGDVRPMGGAATVGESAGAEQSDGAGFMDTKDALDDGAVLDPYPVDPSRSSGAVADPLSPDSLNANP